MASDLKSDLVMTVFQRRPTVHLMDNPAVALTWIKLLMQHHVLHVESIKSNYAKSRIKNEFVRNIYALV